MSTAPGAGHRWIDAFADAVWLEDGLSRNSLAAYRRDLALLDAWLAVERGVALHEAGAADLHGYIAHRHPDSRPSSANRRLAVFRRFFRYLVRERVRDEVAQRLPLFGFYRGLLRWLFLDPTSEPPQHEGVDSPRPRDADA